MRIHALVSKHEDDLERSGVLAPERNFRQRRADVAFQFLGLPDEITAELRLAAEYSGLLSKRAAYYLRIRREEVARVVERPAADPFTPFAYFFADLRASLYMPVVGSGAAEYSELARIARWAAAGLADSATPEVLALCTSLRPSLLDVSLEAPIDSTDAAYIRLFEALMSVERAGVPSIGSGEP